VDLKYKYTPVSPQVRAAKQRLDDLDAELRDFKQKHDRLYVEMQANPAPAFASLAIQRFRVHFDGEPTPADHIIYHIHRATMPGDAIRHDDTMVLRVPGGAEGGRAHPAIPDGDTVRWDTDVSAYTGKTVVTELRRVSDYYDSDGRRFGSDSAIVKSEAYQITAGVLGIGGLYDPRQRVGAPAGTAVLKYRYELRVYIRDEHGPHSSETRSSDTHTIEIEKTSVPKVNPN